MNTGLQLFGAILCSVQLLSAQGTQAAVPATAEDFFRLIRANDLDAVRQLAAKSGAASVRTSLGETPLHYAARGADAASATGTKSQTASGGGGRSIP